MFDIFPDDIREALIDIFEILKKRNPTKIVTQFQSVGTFITNMKKWWEFNTKDYSMPSTMAGGKSLSWHREVIIVALARIKFRDKRPKIWLVTSPSSTPLHLANTAASCLTWAIAPECSPPRVSTAKGRKTMPSRRQASSVSLIFLW